MRPLNRSHLQTRFYTCIRYKNAEDNSKNALRDISDKIEKRTGHQPVHIHCKRQMIASPVEPFPAKCIHQCNVSRALHTEVVSLLL